jgi:hypothetical protein
MFHGLEALEPRLMFSAGPFHFTDADGDEYSVRLAGRGAMNVQQHPDTGGIDSIDITNSNGRSRLIVEVAGGGDGVIDLWRVTSTRSLGSIRAPDAALFGRAAVLGSIPGRVDLLAIVGGELRATGNIGKVTVGGLFAAVVFAGIGFSTDTLPQAADVVSRRSIKSIHVTGDRITTSEPEPIHIHDSHISAWRIGRFTGGWADTDNAGVPFGFAVKRMKHWHYTDSSGVEQLRKVHRLGDASDGDFHFRVF